MGEASHIFPTARLKPEGHRRVLDVVVRWLDDTGTAPRSSDIAEELGLGTPSVAESKSFMVSVGLIEPGTQWVPTAQGRRLAELRTIDIARSRLHLRDLLAQSWFAVAAREVLADRSLSDAELVDHLMGLGTTQQRARAAYLVEWLVQALIVDRDEERRLALVVPEPRPGVRMGMGMGTLQEMREMPEEEFIALMDAYGAVLACLPVTGIQGTA